MVVVPSSKAYTHYYPVDTCWLQGRVNWSTRCVAA